MATREPGPVPGKNYIRHEYLLFSPPRVDRRLPVGQQLYAREPMGLAGAVLAIVERGVELDGQSVGHRFEILLDQDDQLGIQHVFGLEVKDLLDAGRAKPTIATTGTGSSRPVKCYQSFRFRQCIMGCFLSCPGYFFTGYPTVWA